jgi:hypothetical protein
VTAIAHLAGQVVEIGPHMRQRCVWCGSALVEYDLTRIAIQVEPGQEPEKPATWPLEHRVIVEGENPRMGTSVPPPAQGERIGDGLPEGVVPCCDELIVSTSAPIPRGEADAA